MFELINSAQAAEEVLQIGNLMINIGWWPFVFAIIKYVFIIITIILIIGIVLILVRVEGGYKIRLREAVEEAMEAGRLPKTKTQREWETISSAVESKNPEDYKNAVILAEKLFSRVLKFANFSGSTIEERLRKIPDNQLEYQKEIIWSCALKDKILSDDDYVVEHEEAKRAVYNFEKVFKEMNIL
ncbi:MAG: hypothetical protein KAI67_02190 [Candidatus Pacebacteria bacterium]|nr:hypothetical protein [Candidatus Paceibacterota bacterium]